MKADHIVSPHRRLSRSKAAPRAGIVHIGLGAFFRAFGTHFIEDAIDAAGGDWGVLGVSLRSSDVRDRLLPQDCIYTSVEIGPDGQKTRIVQVLTGVLFAPPDPGKVLARMADPKIKVVTLTITEKGYCHFPSTGTLNLAHPDIHHDLTNPMPRSAVGYLVRALEIRRAEGHNPFTVLSCDNLPNNGRVAQTAVTEFAKALDPSLADWILNKTCFPATMVDRIVPATTSDDIVKLSEHIGYKDQAPVFHEPFRQWVIEDNFFDNERPAFENLSGAHIVDDVAPFEHMKLRMLNGTHSALAYLGYLAGNATIAETVADPIFNRFVRKLWEREIIPTLTPPAGVDLQIYANALMERYSNEAIRHRTWQIAMDGSQKLPQRILSTIVGNLAVQRPCPGLILAVAAWMRYVGGTDEKGRPIKVVDPLAARLRDHSDSAISVKERVENLLAVEEVFDAQLFHRIRDDVTRAYTTLIENGARASCEKLLIDLSSK